MKYCGELRWEQNNFEGSQGGSKNLLGYSTSKMHVNIMEQLSNVGAPNKYRHSRGTTTIFYELEGGREKFDFHRTFQWCNY